MDASHNMNIRFIFIYHNFRVPHFCTQCALSLFLYSYFYHLFRFILYSIFILRIVCVPVQGAPDILHPYSSFERVLARRVSMKMTYSRTFDKGYRRKWPFNGNSEERERERERKIHLARITFFGGIRLKPVKFIRTLHTGWIYTGPYAAGCGHNFEKRLGYADNSPRNVLDNSFPNGPKPNS